MTFEEAFKHIIDKVYESVKSVDKITISNISRIIAESPRTFIYGSGRSGLIGKCFATRLVQLGKVTYFVGESTTPMIEKDDTVFLISNSGRTKSTLLVASISKKNGAKTVCVTSQELSPLTKICDEKIVLKSYEINHNYAPLGTIFEISALVLLDSIVVELMQILGEDEKSMMKRHAIWV